MNETEPKPSGYRFSPYLPFKSEREAGDAVAKFYTDLGIAVFRLVQWCITIGAVQALNSVAPNEWLVVLQAVLWVLLFGYITSNLSTVEIDLFREVNTRLKWWANFIVSAIIVVGLIYGTTNATQAVISAVGHSPKPTVGANSNDQHEYPTKPQ
jgi:hypothetical protein